MMLGTSKQYDTCHDDKHGGNRGYNTLTSSTFDLDLVLFFCAL